MKTSVIRAMAARPRLRAMVLMALASAVVLMLHVPAMALTQVNLHLAHVGASSETFNTEGDTGGLMDAVVWHFVLNGLDHGTPGGTLYVTFASAGAKMATGIPVGVGAMQHFYVGTPTHDVLVSAYAMVDSEGYNNLVLSHVALNEVDEPPVDEPPVDEPPVDEPPVDEPPVDEPPVDEPPVDEPPVDEPPVDEPPVDEPPVDAPPVDEPPVDEPPVDAPPVDEPPVDAPPSDDEPVVDEEDDPFLPFTEDDVLVAEADETPTVVKEESEPFLPFTGVDFGALSMIAAASAAFGAGLRKLGLR